MIVVITSARYAERGTVRAGFFTSPLGINATSIPTKAKINRMTTSPNDLLPGQALQARFGGGKKKNSPQTKTTGGRSDPPRCNRSAPTPSSPPPQLVMTN